MTGRLRAVLAAGLAALVAFVPATFAQQPYTEIDPPLPTGAKDRIEVMEFFWYECPHCYDLEPALEQWVAKLPKDVRFVRTPATFSERWNVSARIYYTLEAMGLLAKLHRPLFDAIHRERLRVTDERQLTDWLQRRGVDIAKFQATYRSGAVAAKLEQAEALVRASKIEGVPALVVNGRYLVSAGGPVTSHAQMLEITDALIAQSRKPPAAARK